jgi:membrane protease YdiL (CAAX protease family)
MLTRVPLAVLFVWLIRASGGAVLPAVLAHALGNFVGELLAGSTATMVVECGLITLAALVVAAQLDRGSRHRTLAHEV